MIVQFRSEESEIISHCTYTIHSIRFYGVSILFRFNFQQLRVIYMVLMFALKDIDTQKRGVVAICYNVGGGSKDENRETTLKIAQLVSIVPFRFTGVHFCYDDEKLRAVFFVAMYVFQKAARIRTRFHLGTGMEIIYTLMTFGIPNEALPLSFNGSLRLEGHRDYVRKMRKTDEVEDDVNRIIVPGKYDVLLGRGKPLQKYSGNLNYHYVIEGYHDRYEAAAKGEKAELAREIVKKIHDQGGRFLKQDDAGWTVITVVAAQSKVSHTFRNHRIAARTALKRAAMIAEASINDAPAVPIQCPSSRSIFSIRENIRMESSNPVDQKRRKIKSDLGVV